MYQFTSKQKRYLKFKRYFDFALSGVLLAATSPIMLGAAIWVKAESEGPVIFKQKRPGYHQNIFTIYKFRTMRTEIKKDGRPLLDDERLTKSGKFLRKTSIDELPQIINILKGEMSFIGPRPFLIDDLGTYNEEQLIRFEVLPGITSWTAIHGRNNVTIQDKYNYEIEYVKNIGFKIDAIIFLKTILLVFSGDDVDNKTNQPRIAANFITEEELERNNS